MAITAVQRKAKGTAPAASLSIGSGDGWATPTAGNLLIASGNSDATITMTTAGFTAGPNVIDGNGAYMWFKVAAGTESTITITPGSSADTVLTVAEYSGATATPFDVSNSSTVSGSSGATTTTAAVTTTVNNDLIVGVAAVHSYATATPSAPSWSNSFVQQLAADSGATSAITSRCCTFYAELLAATPAGAFSTAASWTGNAFDRQHMIMAFKPAAVATFVAGPPIAISQAINRSYIY